MSRSLLPFAVPIAASLAVALIAEPLPAQPAGGEDAVRERIRVRLESRVSRPGASRAAATDGWPTVDPGPVLRVGDEGQRVTAVAGSLRPERPHLQLRMHPTRAPHPES